MIWAYLVAGLVGGVCGAVVSLVVIALKTRQKASKQRESGDNQRGVGPRIL